MQLQAATIAYHNRAQRASSEPTPPAEGEAQPAAAEPEAESAPAKKKFGHDVIDYTGPEDGRSAPKYGAILRPLSRALVALKYRVEVEGEENLPAKGDGGHIFAPTHPSVFDPAVVYSVLDRDVRSMANQQIFRGIGGKVLTWGGAFPVNREGAAPATMRHTKEIIEAGKDLVIFPEGTIPQEEWDHGTVAPIKKGVAAAALSGGAKSIIPIALHYAPDEKPRYGELAVGILAATALTAATVYAGANGGLTARVATGALSGALFGAKVWGGLKKHSTPVRVPYNQAPRFGAMLKGGALGALTGSILGGLACALAPDTMALVVGGLGAAGTMGLNDAWRNRYVAKVLVGTPIETDAYRQTGTRPREAINSLTEDLHRALGKGKEKLTGTPYDESAPKFAGKIVETLKGQEL
ncbi:MAG: hypothetical protein AMXMBFR33_52570 [Candidatus Xenobia bacterium]